MSEPRRESHVIRAPTPPRAGSQQEARETLWVLRNDQNESVQADLIALTDGVEVELFRGLVFRRRWRFLTDSAARRYVLRMRARLERRSYRERRGDQRTAAWPRG